MTISIYSRILWLAKGAALFWGSALTLALLLGVAITALAAPDTYRQTRNRRG